MGDQVSKLAERLKEITTEKKTMAELLKTVGSNYPGSDYHSIDPTNWMSSLNPERLRVDQIAWPGTHDSATDQIGVPLVTRPLAQCQTLSIYEQLKMGTRVLDIRVQEDRFVCHGILLTYSIDVVISDVKKFLGETGSEILILEIRTEFGHEDPPGFESYLEEQLGEYLIRQDDRVFKKTISELLPKRVICVWKSRNSPQVKPGGLLWSSGYLKDNWIDTDLPYTKFKSNMKYLSQQPGAENRKYFYRVENTATPQVDNPIMCVKAVTDRIRPYARLFLSQCFARGFADRMQIFSTDFIDEDFVDACVGLTYARVEGKA